jgi:hypothetical protein
MQAKTSVSRILGLEALAERLPVKPFALVDEGALRLVGMRAVRSLAELLSGNALEAFPMPDWNVDRSSLDAFFGCGTVDHSLSTLSHGWLQPIERQVTEGLAHFLNEGSRSQRHRRALAFLRALDPPRGRPWPEQIRKVSVIAEQLANGDKSGDARIDLIVVAEDAEGRTVGAVLEVKFEHKLGRNPLTAYETQARTVGLTTRNASFLVVGVRKDRGVRDVLGRNATWRFQSWRRVLLGLDHQMPADVDDDDFRRFRSTLFRRIYKEKK